MPWFSSHKASRTRDHTPGKKATWRLHSCSSASICTDKSATHTFAVMSPTDDESFSLTTTTSCTPGQPGASPLLLLSPQSIPLFAGCARRNLSRNCQPMGTPHRKLKTSAAFSNFFDWNEFVICAISHIFRNPHRDSCLPVHLCVWMCLSVCLSVWPIREQQTPTSPGKLNMHK